MNLSQLTDADIGRWVAYRPEGQPHTTEIGRLTGWSHAYIWVRFVGPKRYWESVTAEERTPMACTPRSLRFITMRSDGGFDEIITAQRHSTHLYTRRCQMIEEHGRLRTEQE